MEEREIINPFFEEDKEKEVINPFFEVDKEKKVINPFFEVDKEKEVINPFFEVDKEKEVINPFFEVDKEKEVINPFLRGDKKKKLIKRESKEEILEHNPREKLIKQKMEQSRKENVQIVRETNSTTGGQEETEEKLCNFELNPIIKNIFIGREGQEIYEKETILVEVLIQKIKKGEIVIATSNIDKIVSIIQKRFSAAQVNFRIKKVEKAIEMQFREATNFCKVQKCYIHAGWQIINGKKIYLSDSNNDNKNIKVQTGLSLPCYDSLKKKDVLTILQNAMNLYLDKNVMSTMLLYSFSGVLYRVFLEAGHAPHFLLFLNGKTASMKTTIGKILYTQLIDEQYRENPRRIDSDTVVSFERAIVEGGRDTITLIDDYFPAQSTQGRMEMAKKLEAIVRMVGDGSTKSRSNAMLQDCRGEGVQGMVVITGEIKGKGLSSNLRCLYCNMSRGFVNVEAVTWFQENKYAFSSLISIFSQYVSEDWDGLIKLIRERFIKERRLMEQSIRERRLVDSAVILRIVADILNQFLIKYCGTSGWIGETSIAELKFGVEQTVLQSQEISEDEDPSIIFVRALNELMRVREVVLVEKSILIENSSFDGFFDDNYYYFIPQNVLRKVIRYSASTNSPYLLDIDETMSALNNAGIIKCSSNGKGKQTRYARIDMGGKTKQNFIKINKQKFYGKIEECYN